LTDAPPTTPPSKAEDAFRTIGELADDLGLPQHILRYWETRFPQLRPLQRAGKRRYYRPSDVALVRRIDRLLNHEGYTIRGVQKLLDAKTPDEAAAVAAAEAPSSTPAAKPPAAERDAPQLAVREAEPAPQPAAPDAANRKTIAALAEIRALLADALAQDDA
jgi:DNA-binding transcriptional MerR regulator